MGIELLAGGNDAAYRMRLSDAGAWTELGYSLPNAPLFDMDYDEVDDVLVAATFGRGLWSIGNASDFAAATASSTDSAMRPSGTGTP